MSRRRALHLAIEVLLTLAVLWLVLAYLKGWL